MKKTLALIAIICLSATPRQQPKEFIFSFTPQETQVIFDALGELPAKKVEVIRYKMMTAVQAQSDTTKVKR
jgi:hypothetical protein